MPIGTDLGHRLAAQGFATLQDRISRLQGQVASGVRDPRVSADPMRAAQLSATVEHRTRLDSFERATVAAGQRLAQADTALAEGLSTLQRLQELSLAAASDTLSDADRGPMRAEVLQLRMTLIDVANRRDGNGRALFAGLAEPPNVFTDGPGGVTYHGNGAAPGVMVSESLRLQTALPGSVLFQSIPGTGGRSLFDLADDLAATLSQGLIGSREKATGDLPMRLELAQSPDLVDLRFSIAGSAGSADIALSQFSGAPQALADAINAAAAQTGVRAVVDGAGVRLEGEGAATLSGFERSGPPSTLPLATLDGGTALRDRRLAGGAVAESLRAGHDHMVTQRAQMGALASAVQTQSDALASRRLALETALEGLETLDLAAAMTELQSLLLTQQAAQQSHARIHARTLFDYL